VATLNEKDITGYVGFEQKPYYLPPPVHDNSKLIRALKRTAKFFISLLEKIERGEEV